MSQQSQNTLFVILSKVSTTSIMRFTAAAVAIAASSLVNPINGESLFDDNGRELRGGGKKKPEKLDKYKFTEPADFTGVYHECHYSVTRSSSTGIQTGNFHVCIGHENTPSWLKGADFIIQKDDEFGAYKALAVDDSNTIVEFSDFDIVTMGGLQGFAEGNTVTFHSIGVGASILEGVLLNINDTSDTKICTLFDEGIMQCTLTLIEFCGAASIAGDDILSTFCHDREGEWLNTYSIKAIQVKDGFECPEPPVGYCETNPLPSDHPLDLDKFNITTVLNNTIQSDPNDRHLDLDFDDEEEESRHPCPILAARMNG